MITSLRPAGYPINEGQLSLVSLGVLSFRRLYGGLVRGAEEDGMVKEDWGQSAVFLVRAISACSSYLRCL